MSVTASGAEVRPARPRGCTLPPSGCGGPAHGGLADHRARPIVRTVTQSRARGGRPAGTAVVPDHVSWSSDSETWAFRPVMSHPGHDRPYPCTPCAQPCGQLRVMRGQGGPDRIAPHPSSIVPNPHHALSTSAPRSVACGNRGRSTPSTPLTTATAVISSRTDLVSNVGDERRKCRPPRLGTCCLQPFPRCSRRITPEAATDTPASHTTPAGRTVGRPMAVFGDLWLVPVPIIEPRPPDLTAFRSTNRSMPVSALPRPWRSSR